MTDLSVREISRSECLALLHGANYGHVALTRNAMPAVVPARFAFHDDKVIVHLSTGVHPVAWRDGEVVALHVSHFDDDHHEGWSISVTGPAHATPDLALHQDVPQAPWVTQGGGDLIALSTDVVRGERVAPVNQTPRNTGTDA